VLDLKAKNATAETKQLDASFSSITFTK